MTVILDAGHGKYTKDKGSPYALYGIKPELYLMEYEYNRWIMNAVARELKLKGIKVVKTVTDDTDVPLIQRVSKANQVYAKDKDSFLVSIHVNSISAGKRWSNTSYWSVWTCFGQTQSDIIANYLWDSAKATFKGRTIGKELTDGDNDYENNFYILKNTACPAVLTENFFMDNIKDVEYLLSEEGMKAVVKCHVDGIMNYIKAYNNDKGRTR